MVTRNRLSSNEIRSNEIRTHAPNGATIGINGLGLQALEFEVFKVRNIVLIKLSTSVEGRHVVVPSRIVQNHPNRIDGVSVQIRSCQQHTENLLRVAASSNYTLERTGCKSVTAHEKGMEEYALLALSIAPVPASQLGR